MLLTSLLIPFAFLRVAEWASASKLLLFDHKIRLPPLFIEDSRILPYFAPILAFVGLYSFLPHKEVRFLFPVLSMFNLAAAVGLTRLHNLAFQHKAANATTQQDADDGGAGKTGRAVKVVYLLFYFGGLSTVLMTFGGSALFVAVSHYNYPGGQALSLLANHVQKISHKHVMRDGDENFNPLRIHVHIDVASAMSGVSLFGQRSAASTTGSRWIFEKEGYEENNAKRSIAVTHILSEDTPIDGFRVVGNVKGNPRLNVKEMKIDTEDIIFVLEKE